MSTATRTRKKASSSKHSNVTTTPPIKKRQTPTPPPSTVEATIVKVDKVQAQRWLSNNTTNRPLRAKAVAALMGDMENGRWSFTGEPVQISRTGQLLNGQHRLTAFVESSLNSLDFLDVTGLPDV